uniref:Phospholipid/glycerol acyltransferase domain-containing protein n=1 Tax=Oryza punctata TaxID=4537 RepID=A0A0E0JZD4_ORYPU
MRRSDGGGGVSMEEEGGGNAGSLRRSRGSGDSARRRSNGGGGSARRRSSDRAQRRKRVQRWWRICLLLPSPSSIPLRLGQPLLRSSLSLPMMTLTPEGPRLQRVSDDNRDEEGATMSSMTTMGGGVRKMIGMMCHVFVASWNGMVKYHGPLSSIQSDQQVFVANHTSIIDFIILEKKTTFAVVMQEYSGWIGFLQKFILESVGCIRFNRNSNSERESVARKLQEHVQLPDNNPLLIFPEGTCVNNQYTAAFELGCSVCPIAIKYDKRFTDAFWDIELFRLMTSWAVVCDVWFLDPQQIMPGETAIEFAERVRDMIAAQVGLKKVPWDGYMKHNRPGPRHTQEKQRIYAESALRILEEN